MSLNIDHLVYATPDLASSIDHLERIFGVRAVVGGRHVKWGTSNALIRLGSEIYLEIIGPDPEMTRDSTPELFGIDRLNEPKLVTWAAKSSDLPAVVEKANRIGLSLGEIQTGNRSRPDGEELSWKLTNPLMSRADGIVPFFIDWGGGRHPATDLFEACRLVGFRAGHPDPDRLRRLLSDLGLEFNVEGSNKPTLIATIESPLGIRELR
jgi:hypothetical protein